MRGSLQNGFGDEKSEKMQYNPLLQLSTKGYFKFDLFLYHICHLSHIRLPRAYPLVQETSHLKVLQLK